MKSTHRHIRLKRVLTISIMTLLLFGAVAPEAIGTATDATSAEQYNDAHADVMARSPDIILVGPGESGATVNLIDNPDSYDAGVMLAIDGILDIANIITTPGDWTTQRFGMAVVAVGKIAVDVLVPVGDIYAAGKMAVYGWQALDNLDKITKIIEAANEIVMRGHDINNIPADKMSMQEKQAKIIAMTFSTLAEKNIIADAGSILSIALKSERLYRNLVIPKKQRDALVDDMQDVNQQQKALEEKSVEIAKQKARAELDRIRKEATEAENRRKWVEELNKFQKRMEQSRERMERSRQKDQENWRNIYLENAPGSVMRDVALAMLGMDVTTTNYNPLDNAPTTVPFNESYRGFMTATPDFAGASASTLTFSGLTGDRTGVLPANLTQSMNGRARLFSIQANTFVNQPVSGAVSGVGFFIHGRPFASQATLTMKGILDFNISVGRFTINTNGTSSGTLTGYTFDPAAPSVQTGLVDLNYIATPQ